MSASLFLSLASSNERLTKVPTVTSYQLYPFVPCLYVISSSLSLSGFKEWKTYQSFHSYQLPVTPFPPSTVPLCIPIIYYSLASSNERLTKVPTVTSYQLYPFVPCLYVISSSLSLSGFKEWKTYQSFHSYQLPVTPFPSSTLPLCIPIIYYSLASSNVRLTTVPTVTSYLTTLVSRCVSITLSLSGFK